MSFTNTRDLIGDQATLDGLVTHTLSELYEDGVNTIGAGVFMSNTGLRYVEMPGIYGSSTTWPPDVSYSVFYACTGLISASFPNLVVFGQNMFEGCSSLTDVFAPEAMYGGPQAFKRCVSLQSVSFPKLTRFEAGMFSDCTALQTVYMPEVRYGSAYTFYRCTSLESISLPKLSDLRASMFGLCGALRTCTFPAASIIAGYCFYGCIHLSSLTAPSVSTIETDAFRECNALMSVSFPLLRSVSTYAFYQTAIDRLIFPSTMSYTSAYLTDTIAEVDIYANANIVASTFTGDYNLNALILRNASQCTLVNVNALTSTPIAAGTGYIYVPEELVGSYKEATNWATYASQIVSIDEYPIETVTGTITDSWAEIFAAEENGTYATKYSVGDTKVLDIGKFKIPMQIVAMDTDELAGGGNAKITWMAENLPFLACMNVNSTNKGGWEKCGLRAGLMQTIYNNMDSTVKAAVKTVKKTFYDYTANSTKTVEDTVWIPSAREMFGGTGYESSGCTYTSFFSSNAARVKKRGATGIVSAYYWWLRSASSGKNDIFWIVSDNGTVYSGRDAHAQFGVVFGFCT